MSRPFGTAIELERRRRRAGELLDRGESPTTIARILGTDRSSLYRWRAAARSPAGLAAKPHPGPTPRLAAEHLQELERLLKQGAKAHGWPNQFWTAARVAVLVRIIMGAGSRPQVKAFSGKDGTEIANYFAYETSFSGGVRVAVGAVNGDGRLDIITAPGAGRAAEVRVFGALTEGQLAFVDLTRGTRGLFVGGGRL
jgi:transposase